MPERHDGFGRELYDMRCAKGVTQLGIAARANLGRGYYSQLENSKKGPPSAAVLLRIVQALELNDLDAQRLLAAAVAERCAAACESTWACAPIALLVKNLIQSASHITQAKAARIEAILKED
ncbi:helix-turn-helix domain-containing protein [Massilia sp. Bi118]|jgi:transcriptional regulator with XRE-family HTH domain|uniref:helix-turn-helix domain-containing protein n=1 Tax=Massilia sp. Bi118 TaxID=2822346 RepID=UPI001E3B4D68|nr:helix-turn-helix transcriptional regulator [Massilia sp. Bi118]